MPKNPSNSQSPGEPPPSDPDRIFAWTTAEAARNAAKHEAGATRLKLPLSLKERCLRLAQSDREETAVRDRVARLDAERQRRQLVDELLEGCGVPPRYRTASLAVGEALPEEAKPGYAGAIEELHTLLSRPGMIVMLGPRGSGKTYLGCAIVREFCSAARFAVYAEAMDYFLKLDEIINARGSVLKVETSFLRPELLVLDAMEERADTPSKDRMLTRLVNKRYAAELSTVLISNDEEATFNNRVGPSVADRIRDGGCKIECRWKSLRGRVA